MRRQSDYWLPVEAVMTATKYSARFNEFWGENKFKPCYPHRNGVKSGKYAAWVKWKALKAEKSEEFAELLITAGHRYRNHVLATEGKIKFTPDAAKWLHQRMFEDTYPTAVRREPLKVPVSTLTASQQALAARLDVLIHEQGMDWATARVKARAELFNADGSFKGVIR